MKRNFRYLAVLWFYGVGASLSLALVMPPTKTSWATHPRHRRATLYQCPEENTQNTYTTKIDRPAFLRQALVSVGVSIGLPFAVGPQDAVAMEDDAEYTSASAAAGGGQQQQRKPQSPVESLLPALRFQQVLQQARTAISEASSSQSSTATTTTTTLDTLAHLLLSPQNYTSQLSTIPAAPAQQYLEAYRQKRDKLSLLEQPGALLIQKGEIRAWQRLKLDERRREETDEIRAALNAYTNDLSFRTDSYIFNESPQLKSKLIREDRLPDVKTVITSDLGLRYLYRNNVLDAMDDARAELRLLLKEAALPDQPQQQADPTTNSLDLSELKRLLGQADAALNDWFSLIDVNDVRNAQQVLVLRQPDRCYRY